MTCWRQFVTILTAHFRSGIVISLVCCGTAILRGFKGNYGQSLSLLERKGKTTKSYLFRRYSKPPASTLKSVFGSCLEMDCLCCLCNPTWLWATPTPMSNPWATPEQASVGGEPCLCEMGYGWGCPYRNAWGRLEEHRKNWCPMLHADQWVQWRCVCCIEDVRWVCWQHSGWDVHPLYRSGLIIL